MKKTTAQKSTQSPNSSSKAKKYADYYNASGLFFSLALDMTWKLAIAMLAPVILGSFLDSHFKIKSGAFMLSGLVLGLILSIVVIRSTFNESNRITRNLNGAKK